jgi:hypothetical protein
MAECSKNTVFSPEQVTLLDEPSTRRVIRVSPIAGWSFHFV